MGSRARTYLGSAVSWKTSGPESTLKSSGWPSLQTRLPDPALRRRKVMYVSVCVCVCVRACARVCVCVCGWSQCESVSWERTAANTADGLREPQDRAAHRDTPVDYQQQPWRWSVWIIETRQSTINNNRDAGPSGSSRRVSRRSTTTVTQARLDHPADNQSVDHQHQFDLPPPLPLQMIDRRGETTDSAMDWFSLHR